MTRMLLFILLFIGVGCDRQGDTVVVFAAASVGEVIEELSARFETDTGRRVEVHSAASSMLARQIERGARADVVILADAEWMDWLADRGLIEAESRRTLLANRLVIAVPAAHPRTIDLSDGPEQFGSRVAIGDPAHVPVGRYAEEALRALGYWGAVAPRVIPAVDARAALRYVELGEVDSGIVYATDALASGRVEIAAEIPGELHSPIVYPAASGLEGGEGAALFLAFLQTEYARVRLRDAGFEVIR